MQPVDILVGIHLEQRGLVVDLRRRGMLHEHRVDRGVVVERVDRGEQIGLRRVLGQVNVRRGQADLERLLLLHADVARARAVVADEDRREPGREAAVDEHFDARLEVGERRLRDRGAGHEDRAQCRKCRSPVNTIASPSSSAFSMIASSRIAPPGWITAATPAAAAASMPSSKG